VQIIKRHVPRSAVTTDIMVGFPGESDTEFEQSYEFCRQMQFAALHVFMYSARPGTRAAEMPAQVADKVKKERSLRMLSLARDSAAIFRQRFIGGRAGVLFEHEERSGSGLYSGLTQNYIRVYCRGQGPLCNQIRAVSLVKGYRHGLWGEILP
ncbi:MAG TPA: tRNA (N(6)-L-threonylcarbamoyladenosine(37)-C(2))-methylthiotransferase MtaB, partial [Dehalococcoidia bacterium]|nr:tRNA (N(6)-L-threonylcarbamoyladenosine(37)-C(2))-methylthiotransferase MtaB [Dehalococcoidia bacterium]